MAAPGTRSAPSRASPHAQGRLVHHRRTSWAVLEERLFGLSFLGAAAFIVLLFGLFTYILVWDSELSIRTFGSSFLFGKVWDPVHNIYGALPFICGTLVTSLLALLLALPLSLGIAIFLSEEAPGWLRTPLTSLVELLAAVPSVVYGLWGLLVLVPLMRVEVEPTLQGFFDGNAVTRQIGLGTAFSGPIYGADVLTASLVLTLMIVPTISAVSREALQAVPRAQREAALSLGATRWESTRLAVLSYGRSGLVGATILGLGRAVGETMAVTMTIGNANQIPTSLFSQGQTMASLLANDFGEASSGTLQWSALLEIALLLLLITMVINIAARLIIRGIVPLSHGRVE